MNKREVLELKKRFKKDDTTIYRVCGCYVNGEKNILSTFNDSFLNLKEEDFFKYLEIVKKSLSGKLGNNLHNIKFSGKAEKTGGSQQVLMALRDSDFSNEDMLTAFYEHIIDAYCHAGNYLILLFIDNYDVMTRTSDNRKLDESEEVYKYIICAICPVDLSKAALGYKEDEHKIASRERDWVVGVPESAFLFPAFNDRSTDIHSCLFYTKKTTDIHSELIEDVLGCNTVTSYDQKREIFLKWVKNIKGDGITDLVLGIYTDLNAKAQENGCELEEYNVSEVTLKEILKKNLFSTAEADKMTELYKEFYQSNDVKAADIVDEKFLKKNEIYIAYKELLNENARLLEEKARLQAQRDEARADSVGAISQSTDWKACFDKANSEKKALERQIADLKKKKA